MNGTGNAIGTKMKFALSLTLPGSLTMNSAGVDFSCDFYTSKKHVTTVKKSEMFAVSDSQYNMVVDTSEMLYAGDMMCEVKVTVPDSDTTSGARVEVINLDTGEELNYALQ